MEVDIVDGGQYDSSNGDSNRLQRLSTFGTARKLVALTTVSIQPAAVINVFKFKRPTMLRLSRPPMVAAVDLRDVEMWRGGLSIYSRSVLKSSYVEQLDSGLSPTPPHHVQSDVMLKEPPARDLRIKL